MKMPPSSAAGEDDPCSSSGGFQTDTIEDALASFRKGECLLVLDDCDRENEGDLVVSAAAISTQLMAWIIKHSSGYVCIALPGERLDELAIPLMIEANTEKHKTAYTHTVDYKYNTSTGISAHDRALTATKLSDRTSRAEDFTRPGHMVPLRAREGGVLARRGHTEAAIDLCKLAGLPPAGVICELVKPDCPLGSMARRDDCHRFARQWKLKIITIEDLVQYIRKLDHPPSPPKPSTPSSHLH